VSHDQSSPGTGQAAPQRTAPESTRSTLDTDGMLSEWGARLFYPTPKGKGSQGGAGVGAGQLPLFTAVAVMAAAMSRRGLDAYLKVKGMRRFGVSVSLYRRRSRPYQVHTLTPRTSEKSAAGLVRHQHDQFTAGLAKLIDSKFGAVPMQT
jgi:hypothetical protein